MTPSSSEIVKKAHENQKAILAFNVPYLPMVEPVIRAVVDCDGFAFVEVARPEWMKFEAKGPAAVKEEYDKHKNTSHVRLHLDHIPVIDEDGEKVDYLPFIKDALELGFDSVMVDGSRLPLEENIAATKQVVDLAHAAGVPCEAELGAVMGHEEGPLPPYEELFETGKGFTDTDEVKRFVAETSCDWLSVAVGNIHGAISKAKKDEKKVEARLNLDHLSKLSEAAGRPLVLHGGSGIQQQYVLEAMRRGMAKINIGTDIRQAYETTVRSTQSVAEAQTSTYECTCWLIREYYGVAGIRELVAGG